jgi:hypothetical protein
MPKGSQGQKWYRLSIRDQFMFGGFVFGWIAYAIIERHVPPQGAYLTFLPILFMVIGAGIGELVKLKRARNAQGF